MTEIVIEAPDPFGDRAAIVAHRDRMRALGPDIINRDRLNADAEAILATHDRAAVYGRPYWGRVLDLARRTLRAHRPQ